MKNAAGMLTKDFKFELKTVGEDGTFTGMLSVYGVVDLGGDLVEAGAFTKTIKENGGKVPMLWQHKTDEPIGQFELTDTAEGLAVSGTFDLNIQRAKDAYSLVKKRIIKGLSIGYRAIKKKMEGGIRHLKEIELYEGSVVTFPMLPVAQISSVKSAADGTKDFAEELAEAQVWAAHCMMIQALDCALCEIRWSDGLSPEDQLAAAEESIAQFQKAYLAYLPLYFDVIGGYKSADPTEGRRLLAKLQAAKEGRRLSADTQTQIEEMISKLQALLAGEADDTVDETAAAVTPTSKAADPTNTEPETFHSMIEAFRQKMQDTIAA